MHKRRRQRWHLRRRRSLHRILRCHWRLRRRLPQTTTTTAFATTTKCWGARMNSHAILTQMLLSTTHPASIATVSTGDYTLSVEASPALTLPGHTRYRIYLNTPNLNDRLKEVVGSGDSPMTLNVPGGIYNSSLNPLFFPSFSPTTYCPFPELTDDSYLTIGLTTSQAYLPGAQTPALYGGALNNPIVDFFTVDGGTSLTIDDGGGVYVANNTATNIYPDANGRIIVMQVTTDGPISGTLNFGVWPMGGDASTQIDLTISFDGAGEFTDGSGNTSLCGCTNPSAFNYDSAAEHDNGSCLPVVQGCNDPSACTFSYDANVNDGSCADCDFCGVCAGDGLSCSSCTDAARATTTLAPRWTMAHANTNRVRDVWTPTHATTTLTQPSRMVPATSIATDARTPTPATTIPLLPMMMDRVST